MPVPSAITDLSQTAGSNSPAGSESPTTTDDYLRALSSFLALIRDGKGLSAEVDLASAATCDIGVQNTPFVRITGTTTITSFGTNYNGPRFVRFAAALTLTHNATTLILPGGASITTAAGDTCIATPISGGWVVSNYQRAAISSALTIGTVQATTSGTSKDFTSIPAWVRRITFSFSGLSTNGTSQVIVQIGDSGGVEATNYLGTTVAVQTGGSSNNGANYSSGFLLIGSVAAATTAHGVATLTLTDPATNLWCFAVSGGTSNGIASISGGGSKALSATLDRLRLTTANGTDAFDAGAINILYE
jgi:hypothetical protein